MNARPKDLLNDKPLLLALCEALVPSMNGASMRRLTFLLDELRVDPKGGELYEEDRGWLQKGLQQAEARYEHWTRELHRLAEVGIKVVSCVDSEYPVNLSLVHNRPPLLFVNGQLLKQNHRAVAVVGTREASPAGLKTSQELAQGLAESDYTVVSGLAHGIDTAAHAATLNAGGRTIAVFGTPIEHIYPAANRVIAKRISQTGACVSQFLPRSNTGPWAFPARNITTSGLSLATVVVEASPSSGARHQAEAALKHGKRVFLFESLVTSQPWAKEMLNRSLTVSQVNDPKEIVEELDNELCAEESAFARDDVFV